MDMMNLDTQQDKNHSMFLLNIGSILMKPTAAEEEVLGKTRITLNEVLLP